VRPVLGRLYLYVGRCETCLGLACRIGVACVSLRASVGGHRVGVCLRASVRGQGRTERFFRCGGATRGRVVHARLYVCVCLLLSCYMLHKMNNTGSGAGWTFSGYPECWVGALVEPRIQTKTKAADEHTETLCMLTCYPAVPSFSAYTYNTRCMPLCPLPLYLYPRAVL